MSDKVPVHGVHVVDNQTVLTYEIDGKPQGVLTGYADGTKFVLCHVMAFPNAAASTLPRMLHVGLAEAWTRGYEAVLFCIMRSHPQHEALCRVGERLGFVPYDESAEKGWWVKWRS